MTIHMFPSTGKFAENKDVARDIRLHKLLPALERGEKVILDFAEVQSATQSFVHALISDAIRKFGVDVLDRLAFKSCNDTVRAIIDIVVDYMQEGMGIEREEAE